MRPMSDPAIRVENLSKRYRIGLKEEMHDTLGGAVAHFITRPVRNVRRLRRLSTFSEDGHDAEDIIWALKDVSFEVRQGEVVGIIGRNGAGKSTLLKILTRITDPSQGYAEISGRVGSLLEVGTGFHPELTGRENIFLNGAVLGMARGETQRKFDEIVDFAEVEQFIDTPVKRYSSGMKVRLAFAVAAHLEPEVLLVDEVLAVGDVGFQKKCIGKMEDVTKEGRTVLFVSHNMAAIMNLCSRTLLLEDGELVTDGETDAVVDHYLKTFVLSRSEIPLKERHDREGNQRLRFLSVAYFRAGDDRPTSSLVAGEDSEIVLSYESTNGAPLRNVLVAIAVHGRHDERLFQLTTTIHNQNLGEIPPNGRLVCRVPQLPLQPGRYTHNVFCAINSDLADWVQNAGTFEVVSGDFFGTGRLPPVDQGPLLVSHSWRVE